MRSPPSNPLAAVGLVGTPAIFNFFRPSGPNPSFAAAVPGGYGTLVALAQTAGYPAGFGVPVPFNSVDAQRSDASSWYHALTVNVTKRFSHGFELLSSYTWSHSIDDGTDLQSTLEPQDSRFPFLERGNSDNDQRHRWVTSAVIQSGTSKSGDSLIRIGRDPANDVVLDEEGVSSHHARILVQGNHMELEDLGSEQGTYVGSFDRRIQRCPIEENDVVFLGKNTIRTVSQLIKLIKAPEA